MVHYVDNFPGREIILKGEKFLYFGGTAYLGLQTDSEFLDIHIKNIKNYGTNYGASRKANVRLSIYKKAEAHLSKLIGSQNCLTLSSGYLAGQMVSRYFHGQGHLCFFAPGMHEAVHSWSSKNHVGHDKLIQELNESIGAEEKSPVLFLESIDLDGGNYPNFDWLKKLHLEKLILVVDDSHGFGIVGDEGGGVFKSLEKLNPKELLVCGSLGKGFGIQGGIVAGNDQLIADLKVSDMFSASSPASPASLATLNESFKILTKKRKLLQENVDFFLDKLTDSTLLNFMPEYPSFAFNDTDLSIHLRQHHIIVTDFNYPTESDPVVQRIVLSAQHSTEDIIKLANAINAYIDRQ